MIQFRPEYKNFPAIPRPLFFQGEKPSKKTRLSDEERAARQALEEKAPAIRKALPWIFKLWSPLPSNGGGVAKYGHIVKFLEALKKTPWFEGSPELQQQVEELIATGRPNGINEKSGRYLEELKNLKERVSTANAGHIQDAMLQFLPVGPLRDSVIDVLVRKNIVTGLAALPTVSNPQMRAALSVMVQNLADLDKLNKHEHVAEILDAAAKARPEQKTPVTLSTLKQIPNFTYYSPLIAEGETAPLALQNLDAKRKEAQSSGTEGSEILLAELPSTPAPFLSQALGPYLDCGLSLLDLPPLIGLLSQLQMDEGTLVSEVIPAYQRFVDFALKRPDKFVKAGEPLPSADKIRAMLHKDGQRILQTIILVGDAPLKNALDMKRLPNLLNRTERIICQQMDMLKPVAALSRMFEDPYNSLKLLDYVACVEDAPAARPEMAAAMEKMIANGKPEMNALGKIFLKKILAFEVLKDVVIPDAQVDKWNLTYLSTLAAALKNMPQNLRIELLDVCKAALEGRYHAYLHDPASQLGQANIATRKAFGETFANQGIQLNYDQWLNYKKTIEFERPSNVACREALNEALNKAFQQTMDKNPIKQDMITAHLASKGLAFREGRMISTQGGDIGFRQYVAILDMYREIAVDSGYRERMSQAHDLYNRFRKMPAHDQRLKIELWEREPGHDLFLGNYTGACIALDNTGNGKHAVEANQNTFVQVAYVKNPETNKVVGKALFFLAKDLDTGLPVMVLNTYEGRGPDNEGNYEDCPIIRQNLVEFAKNYSRAVVGWAVPLYTGMTLNPICCDGLTTEWLNLSVVGKAYNDRFYLDAIPYSFGPVSADLYVLDRGETRPSSPPPPLLNTLPETNQPSPAVIQTGIPALSRLSGGESSHRIEITNRPSRPPLQQP